MDKKQTAVNWLIKNLMLNGLIRLTQDQHSLYKELTEKAKAMEKEQIMDANIKGHTESLFGRLCDSEKYYNETFKSE